MHVIVPYVLYCRYQMCVLLLFNRRDAYTYDETKEETSIPDRELTRALRLDLA